MEQHWLSIIIVVAIIAIIIDGLRRMRKARRDSIKMALKPASRPVQTEEGESEDHYGSEFPNGGARVSKRKIDPERINQVRNKYDFGTDMTALKNKVAETIAEHTGTKENEKQAPRIEPSVADVDPLLDDMQAYRDDLEAAALGDIDQPFIELETADTTQEPSAESKEPSGRGEKPLAEEKKPLTANKKPVNQSIQQPVEATEQTREEAPTEAEAAITTEPETAEKVEPVQASLNLEDAVPMLMDSVSDQTEGDEDKQGLSNEEQAESIVAVATHIEPVAKDQERTLVAHSANKPRYESKYTDHKQHHLEEPQEVLVIHIRAPENEYFYGSDLLDLILDNGLRFGAMDIFHRHAGDDGEGPILFSMANMVKPGVFDLHTFEEFSTVGLSFFLGLPTETGTEMQAFDAMLNTAKDMASRLQGELKDENRSVLTKQTIEHYRERIRDFARRQQLEKNKP